MAVQFSDELIDELLAPGMAALTEFAIPELEMFKEEDCWISNLFLNSLFETKYKRPFQQATIAFMTRTQFGLRSYRAAREYSLNFVDKSSSGRPAHHSYFKAVGEWETCLFNLQITFDLLKRVLVPGIELTEDALRMHKAANRVKHFAEDIEEGSYGATPTVPLWLGYDRLLTRHVEVTYAELAETLCEMAKTADILQLPHHAEKERPQEAAT